MVVVIPCHDEPALLDTLNALWRCRPVPCGIEVVVVINGASTDAPAVKARNRRTWEEAQRWRAERARTPPWHLHLLYEPALPPRHAGVGTARKIGMDWAMTRFDGAQRDAGVIVSLDADCTVAENYLNALHDHFKDHPRTPGCTIHFEHPLTTLPPHQRQGIVYYELYMRYYMHTLRWSGFPYAYHTVGSSMAVRAAPYRQQGGMNRRKAGEDFYFLQKIIPLGHFSELRRTTVYPSPRPSLRVPFGTGRVIAAWLSGEKNPGWVCDPKIFQSLGMLFERVPRLYDEPLERHVAALPPPLQQFLKISPWAARIREIATHTRSRLAFQKRFFGVFNAFQVP